MTGKIRQTEVSQAIQ